MGSIVRLLNLLRHFRRTPVASSACPAAEQIDAATLNLPEKRRQAIEKMGEAWVYHPSQQRANPITNRGR